MNEKSNTKRFRASLRRVGAGVWDAPAITAWRRETLRDARAGAVPWTVAVYRVDLAYGGPQEGGWYFHIGERVRIARVYKRRRDAQRYCRRYNDLLATLVNAGLPSIYHTNSEGMLDAQVWQGEPPAGYPDRRPHYE